MSLIPSFCNDYLSYKKNHLVLFANFAKFRRIESFLNPVIGKTLIQDYLAKNLTNNNGGSIKINMNIRFWLIIMKNDALVKAFCR